MALKDTLPELRERAGLTQQQLAEKLYVTRQAVSRWETGKTAPSVDMLKLLAVTLGVPVTALIELPPEGTFCQSCGMFLAQDGDRAHAADGTTEADWCKWCMEDGQIVDPDETMEEMIERCAPYMVESGSFATLDEAVSLLGAVLPQLKRWRSEEATGN